MKKLLIRFLVGLHEISVFSFRFFKELIRPPYEINETLSQSYHIGSKSLPLVSIIAFVIGLVLVVQSRPSLVEFGAGGFIPAMAAASIIREVGPMITGLVCAGNIGSSISAELGSMRVTEQIDSMEVSGSKPFKYLVVTRVVSTTLVIPMLVVYADYVSLLGAFVGANLKDEISFNLFFQEVFEKLTLNDILPSFIKTIFFGYSIGMIGCYTGFTTEQGTEGVGRSANTAVIISMILVIIIDMVATQLSSVFHLI